MKINLKMIVNLFFLFTLSTTVFAKRAFIIDTDVAPDDQVAMMYLLKKPDIDIKAITIVSTGEAHCQPAMQNVLTLLQLTHHTDIPIACGRDQPLVGSHQFPDWLRKEADETSSYFKKTPLGSQKQAADLLINQLQQASQPIDILAIGPLTNIADAIQKQPEIKHKIHRIYFMGGAIQVKGNVNDTDKSINNTFAEWNAYIDPTAAHIVLNSGIPMTVIPLDVTNFVPIDSGFYHSLSHYPHNTCMNYVYELYHRKETEIVNHRWYFWDALAAVIASDESIASMQHKKIQVVLSPDVKSGATVVDNKSGVDVSTCFAMNKSRFKKLLLRTIGS